MFRIFLIIALIGEVTYIPAKASTDAGSPQMKHPAVNSAKSTVANPEIAPSAFRGMNVS